MLRSLLTTRLAPVLFVVTTVPVVALALWFYGLALRSVEGVLERQTAAAAEQTGRRLAGALPDLELLTAMPARSASVRDALGSRDPSLPDGDAVLSGYADWFLQQADGRFTRMYFVTADGSPLLQRLPASASDELSPADSDPPLSIFDMTDSRGLPDPGQTLRISVQPTRLHGNVFRFARPAGLVRRFGRPDDLPVIPSGYICLEAPVANVFADTDDAAIELLLLRPADNRILYAPAHGLFDAPMSVLDGVGPALQASRSDSVVSGTFDLYGERHAATLVRLGSPDWTVVASQPTTPHVSGPQRSGRITLATTALFVLLSGTLILVLVGRVQRRTRDLEEANRQITEATHNKSQFLRRMSHDLRSPMNAIIGYTRLLQRRLADRMDERESRNLANIETSSGNLLNLINDILDLSRIEAGRMEVAPQPVDVRQLADECADALESIVKEGVELRRELEEVEEIQTDPDRLRQVVMNLLGNATKFTDSGSITLSLRRTEGAAELSVADTGVGIPPDDLPHIFDEFRQVERQGGEQTEGTGLGLAIAKKTVDLLGGTISAQSDVGAGTTFTLRIGDYRLSTGD